MTFLDEFAANLPAACLAIIPLVGIWMIARNGISLFGALFAKLQIDLFGGWKALVCFLSLLLLIFGLFGLGLYLVVRERPTGSELLSESLRIAGRSFWSFMFRLLLLEIVYFSILAVIGLLCYELFPVRGGEKGIGDFIGLLFFYSMAAIPIQIFFLVPFSLSYLYELYAAITGRESVTS